MIKQILTATIVVLLAACQANDIEPKNTEMLAGGWQQTEISAEIKKAATFALEQLGKPAVEISSISDIQQQVVAGMNYSFLMKLSDKTQYLTTVYQDLENNLKVTKSEKISD